MPLNIKKIVQYWGMCEPALSNLICISGHFDGEDISKAKDEGIMKRIKENGEGFDHPNVRLFIQM